MNRRIAIKADDQRITQGTRLVQVAHVPRVKQIETAVREYQHLPFTPQLFSNPHHFFE